MRFNELIAGVRSDVAIKVYGDDLEQLAATAAEIESVVSAIEGSVDAQTDAEEEGEEHDGKNVVAAGRSYDVGRHDIEQRIQPGGRAEEHTSELQSPMRISYAVWCLKKK